MVQNDVKRSFNMTFSELTMTARNLCVVLVRDLDELSIFGLTSTSISNLSLLVKTFENMRTDIEFEGDVMVKTQEKLLLSEQVKDQIRFMSVRVDAAFGTNSVVYDTFRFYDLNLLSDRDLYEALRRITRLANQYIDELSVYGVSAALIIQLEELQVEFLNAMDTQESAQDTRRIASSERTIAANEIYSFVSNYSNFGKKLYVKSNPAKYQDYVLYGSSSSSSKPDSD